MIALLQPFSPEFINEYLDAYLAAKDNYGWAGWLLMTAVLIAVWIFLWQVVRVGFNRIANDAQGSFKIAVGLIKEATAALTAVKITMDGAAVERQVLIDKVDALEAVVSRLEQIISNQGKLIDDMKMDVKTAGAAHAEAIMTCRVAQEVIHAHKKDGG